MICFEIFLELNQFNLVHFLSQTFISNLILLIILGKFSFDNQIVYYLLYFDKVRYYYTGLNFDAILSFNE